MENNTELQNSLLRYTDRDFASFVPKSILHLSEIERLTVEFAFWFCHTVEQDVNTVLRLSAEVVKTKTGEWPKELDDFIRETYGVKLEVADPTHPQYDSEKITFGQRILFIEKIRGTTPQVLFLRKVKKIRNDLSHGRIKSLTYEGKSLMENEVKRKLITDYVDSCVNIENESVGGLTKTAEQST